MLRQRDQMRTIRGEDPPERRKRLCSNLRLEFGRRQGRHDFDRR